MTGHAGLFVALWVSTALVAMPSRGAESPALEAMLRREIVGSVLPMAEVQRFSADRVPRMPKVDSAEAWQREADRLRAAVLEKIVYRGAAAGWRDAKTRVQWMETIPGGPGYHIKKLRYEALPGLWIPALLYEPDKLSGKVPGVLNVNGHVGAPGKAYVPKQLRCINQAKRGMLALNLEWVGMGQLSGPGFAHSAMNQIDLCGASGLAPFYLDMKRGLDILLSLDHVDPQRIAVTGLSGGGWQTIFLSSLDTRVKLANPVAGYSSFITRAHYLSDLGDSEQTPNDLATIVDYTHLTAMMAPRPTLLTNNSKDNCCFASGHAQKPLLDAARPIFRLFGKENNLRRHVNDDPGTHNYEIDNRQAFYGMLGDFFYPGDKHFDRKEIPSEKEVKSVKELTVKLPEKNENFHTLAMRLAKDLPRNAELPLGEMKAAVAWQTKRRAALKEIVKAQDYRVTPIKFETERPTALGSARRPGVRAVYWRFQMDGTWTVPGVELVQNEPQKTAILVCDGGRASAAREAGRLLAAGYRVVAVDPFYFGESKIAQRDYLFALLVAAVGHRPLGIQASQVAAIARWAAAEHKGNPVTLVAVGPRSCVFALVAGALETKAVAGVELHGSLGSLKEVIERNWTVNTRPELFCFGLLEDFDLKQIAAVVAPRPVRFVDPSDRVKKEMAGLTAWYALLGGRFSP